MEWLAGGGLVTLIGLSVFLWLRSIQDDRFRGEMRQALLGYGGRGGIMADLEAVKKDLADLRERIGEIAESLRDEINDRLNGLEKRIRELEQRRTA